MIRQSNQLTGFISAATFSKLLLNVTRRLIYPFAPEFARGLDVELSTVTSIIAVNNATAVLGPIGASFADKYGYRILLLFSLGLLAVSTFAIGVIPVYSLFLISLFLAGFAKTIFDPSLQAYIAHLIPFEKRGRVIGIIELSWAGCTLIGIPFSGIIIEKFSWQTPFSIIGVLSLICFFMVLKIMPREKKPAAGSTTGKSLVSNWRSIIGEKKVLGILCFIFFMSMGNDNLFVIYGAWLETSYDLSLKAIGFGTILIGLAEVLGEICTILFADRIGLKRSVIIGVILSSFAYFLLPVMDIGVAFVLSGLFLVFFVFEFTIVTSMGLSTELVPELRASTMAAYYAVGGMGRVAGAFSGGIIWTRFGLLPICILSGCCAVAALVSILLGFRSRPL